MIALKSDFGEKRESPDRAMRLLFGAAAIDAMPQDRTVIRNVGDLRVRAEQTSRMPEKEADFGRDKRGLWPPSARPGRERRPMPARLLAEVSARRGGIEIHRKQRSNAEFSRQSRPHCIIQTWDAAYSM